MLLLVGHTHTWDLTGAVSDLSKRCAVALLDFRLSFVTPFWFSTKTTQSAPQQISLFYPEPERWEMDWFADKRD